MGGVPRPRPALFAPAQALGHAGHECVGNAVKRNGNGDESGTLPRACDAFGEDAIELEPELPPERRRIGA